MQSIASLLGIGCVLFASATVHAEDEEFFNDYIEPLLQNNCYDCHSHESGEASGGLVLDSKADWSLGGDSGRDHNPHGYTIWMAGGGVKAGYAHGATDDFGYLAIEDKVHMHDLHATILRLLGIDHERLTYRYAGRDFRLTDFYGHVVDQVIA